MNEITRRMEAIPLAWDALSDKQRDAVETAAAWLVDALGSIPPIKRSSAPTHRNDRNFGQKLDRNRRSQLGFIDGDRGTGKSSVMLTLEAITSDEPFDIKDTPESVAKLYEKRYDVVWLETLDMEPLSHGCNLFAAILARVAQVLDKSMGERSHPMALAMADTEGDHVLSLLTQLQNDAAIVWDRLDGNVQGGDPQARALWVTQAEKAGLDLNRRFGELLDSIARTRSQWSNKDENPLFVLPVDDFDLAPAHCLELLRLIRMVTTPRLFFLVAGNIRIAESVLRLRSEGDMARLAGSKSFNASEIQLHAAEIAANNLRKLIPPSQRASLLEFRLYEAICFVEKKTAHHLNKNWKRWCLSLIVKRLKITGGNVKLNLGLWFSAIFRFKSTLPPSYLKNSNSF